jgi:hypothetical protein
MGVLDATFRALATSLVGKYRNSSSTLTRISEGAGYNPVDGSISSSSTSASIKRSPAMPFRSQMADDEVLQGDLYCYVDAASCEAAGVSPVPGGGYRVELDGYRVISATSLESGDQVAAYLLHLREA